MKKQPCLIDGILYESERKAARTLGITLITVRSRLRSSNFPEYISKYHPKAKRKRKIASIACTIKGVKYVLIATASKKLKMNISTISRRLASFNFPDYVSADVPKVAQPTKPPRYKVSGKEFHTLQEIGNVEGLTKERIRQKINDPSYKEYQRL